MPQAGGEILLCCKQTLVKKILLNNYTIGIHTTFRVDARIPGGIKYMKKQKFSNLKIVLRTCECVVIAHK
ncbi:MAG TPA: hypothetical protein DER09_04730 [Prolixibacteraceae bacterium]|nr:hypothetical protein [Prolixibacteraceae bacterium]